MLEGELSDPRIASSHVTEVILAPGGKSCRVLVAVHGDEDQEDATLEGLMAARAYIRTEIRDRMGVRHVPEITFAIDRSEKIGARMDQVFENIEKRRKKMVRNTTTRAAKTAAPQGNKTPTHDSTDKAK